MGLCRICRKHKKKKRHQKIFSFTDIGFVQFSTDSGLHAVVRIAEKDVPWERMLKDFVSSFKLSPDFEMCYIAVPISSLVLPLMAFRTSKEDASYSCVLPKRHWAAYFDDKIKIDEDVSNSELDESGNDQDSYSDKSSDIDDLLNEVASVGSGELT